MPDPKLNYSDARRRIAQILADGDWHRSTRDIHEPLATSIPDSWFGKVKKELGIEHRWNGPNGVGSRGLGSYVEWRLPSS